MVPTRSEANAHAGGQIDEPVRFPCPHRGCGGIAILMVLFPISRPNWRSAQVAVTRLLFFLVDVSQMGWLGRSGSPLAPHLLPQRHHAHRGYRDPGVDLAFTAVLAMLIRSDRGLLRLFRWRVPVWIGTISEGFYFSTFQA